jgi:hypothetical protein
MTGKAHKYDFVNAFTLKTKDLKSLLVDEKVDKTMIALQANKSSIIENNSYDDMYNSKHCSVLTSVDLFDNMVCISNPFSNDMNGCRYSALGSLLSYSS